MRLAQSSLSIRTEAELTSLHKSLLDQFKNSHDDARKRRFLEDPDKAGTFADEQRKEGPQQLAIEGVQPILVYDPAPLKEHAVSLQKWEGIVTNVDKDVFYARLHDLTAENPEEKAEISIDEVSEDDRKLLKPGAVFYWSIGYLTTGSGQRIRTSVIKFRRLPAWTEREIDTARKQADELRRIIGWGNDEAKACAG